MDLQGDGVLPVAQLREALLQARVARGVRVAIRGGVVSVESGGEGFEVVERQAEAGVKESVVEELVEEITNSHTFYEQYSPLRSP